MQPTLRKTDRASFYNTGKSGCQTATLRIFRPLKELDEISIISRGYVWYVRSYGLGMINVILHKCQGKIGFWGLVFIKKMHGVQRFVRFYSEIKEEGRKWKVAWRLLQSAFLWWFSSTCLDSCCKFLKNDIIQGDVSNSITLVSPRTVWKLMGEHYDLLYRLRRVGCYTVPYEHFCRREKMDKSWCRKFPISSRVIEDSCGSATGMFEPVGEILFRNQGGYENENCHDRPCNRSFLGDFYPPPICSNLAIFWKWNPFKDKLSNVLPFDLLASLEIKGKTLWLF